MRIFSLPELQAGQVPTREDFLAAKDLILQSAQNPLILGGCLFGSLLGKPTSVSDADVLCIVPDPWMLDYEKALTHLRKSAEQVYRLHHVPVQAIVVGQTAAKHGRHDVTLGLYEHLRASHVSFGKEDVFSLLGKPPGDLAEEAYAYASRKLGVLAKFAVSWDHLDPSDRHRALAKALDAPVHAARKMLHAMTSQSSGGAQEIHDRLERLARERTDWTDGRVALACLRDVMAARKKYEEDTVPNAPRSFADEDAYEQKLTRIWLRVGPLARLFCALVHVAPL